MKHCLLVMILSCGLLLAAQEGEKVRKPRFYGIAGGGYAGGESGAFPVATAVAGFDLQILKVGIGGGYDGYRFASFPVFFDIRKDFFSRKKVFGYASTGYHFAKDNETFSPWSWPSSESWKGGLYLDAGLGVHFKMFKSHRLNFSMGYNYKKIRHTERYTIECLIPPCKEIVYSNVYGLNYLVTRLSWEVN